MATMHSAGQIARRASLRRPIAVGTDPRHQPTHHPATPPPVAGGVSVTDIFILALSGILALLRSLPLAELFDFVVAAGLQACAYTLAASDAAHV